MPNAAPWASAYDSVASLLAAYGLIGIGTRSSVFGMPGFDPYTDDDDATMTWASPARRAAPSTCILPAALTWWLAIGSAIERGTDGRAARCTMAPAPASTSSRASASRMLP